MGMLAGLRQRWAQRHATYMERQGATHALTHRITAISKWVRYCQQSFALGAGALLLIDGQLTGQTA